MMLRSIRWILRLAWLDAKRSGFRGLVMLASMVFGLSVMVSFSALKESFRESFYLIACGITGGDLRIDISGQPGERLKRLLPRLGDQRVIYHHTVIDAPFEAGQTGPMHLWIAQEQFPAEAPVTGWERRAEGDLPEVRLLLPFLPDGLEFASRLADSIRDAGLSEGLAHWDVIPVQTDGDPIPLWLRRILPPHDRAVMALIPSNTDVSDAFGPRWQQSWIFHLSDGISAAERIRRGHFILNYLREEAYGVDLAWELPSDTAFHRAYRLIANTLFLAAFVALLLGTLAYTVTFVDFFRSRADQVALMRCLGSTMGESWAVYGAQVLLYSGLSVFLAGVFSVGIQVGLPAWVGHFASQEVPVEILWRPLVASLVFGGFFILIPGMIAILPLLGCEPVEVLRSVKMPSRVHEHRWMQRLMVSGFILAAVGYCLWMVEDRAFALAVIGAILLVFAGIVLFIAASRWLLRRLFSSVPGGRAWHLWQQASANLYRKQNAYGFSLSAIGFGVFLVMTLHGFFRSFSSLGVDGLMGLSSGQDWGALSPYLRWLEEVFFLNQIGGVIILTCGVLSVFVLLTMQRRNRIHEMVILAVLGADSLWLRWLMLAESALAGAIAGASGILAASCVAGWAGRLHGLAVSSGLDPLVAFVVWVSCILLMVVMGGFNIKGIVGFPPLIVLRRRRHFANW